MSAFPRCPEDNRTLLTFSVNMTSCGPEVVGAARVHHPSIRPSPNPSEAAGLSDRVPDALEEAIALCQSVQRIVALAHRSHEAAEGVDVVLALDGTAVLVDLGDRNLDRGVVLGLDDAVGSAALARDIPKEGQSVLMILHVSFAVELRTVRVVRRAYKSTISPRSFSMFAACVGEP